MQYGLETITEPESEPVTLTVVKAHLRIDHTAEDTLITSWITAARRLTEAYTGRRWIEQELRLTLARFPACYDEHHDGTFAIRLPVAPIATIDEFTYVDAAGDEQELEAGDYQTWLAHNPPLVLPAVNGVWPQTQVGKAQAVTIEFTAGGEAAAVPEQVKTAIKLILADWDKNRAGEGTIGSRGEAGSGLPPAARHILDSLWDGGYR